MNSGFSKRGRAAEESYFERAEREALEKLRQQQAISKPQVNSPVSGQPMEIIAFEGADIMKCSQSGGVWLDSAAVQKLLPRFDS